MSLSRSSLRSLVLVTSALFLGRSVGSAQVDVDSVPQGANWVADARTRVYYPIGCSPAKDIPQPDRLYYKDEASLQRARFTKSEECGAAVPRVRNRPEEPRPNVLPNGDPSANRAAVPDQNLRKGFWFSLGLGYGSMGCQDCSGRTGGASGGLALGGAVSPKVLLGVGTNAWTKSEFDARVTVGTLAALIRFYPSATGGFFLLGGLGLGTIRAEASTVGSLTETGVGAVLGLGYDIRLGRSVSLTPYWNGFAASTENADANVGQLGLGLTVH